MGRSKPIIRAIWARRIPTSQDTYFVGTMKGVGRIYQQTFIDTYSRVAQAKLYLEKTAITAADMLNDKATLFCFPIKPLHRVFLFCPSKRLRERCSILCQTRYINCSQTPLFEDLKKLLFFSLLETNVSCVLRVTDTKDPFLSSSFIPECSIQK